MAGGQRVRQRALEMQAQQSRGNDDGQRRERAVHFLVRGDLFSQRGFERGLKRAEMDFAWRFAGKIVSANHGR